MFFLPLCNEKENKNVGRLIFVSYDLEDLFSIHCVAVFAPEYLEVTKFLTRGTSGMFLSG